MFTAFLGQYSVALRDILSDLIYSPVGSTTKWFSLRPNPEKKTSVIQGELNISIILPKPSIMQFATDHFPAMVKSTEDTTIDCKLSDKVELDKLAPSERHRLEILYEFYQTEVRYVNDIKLIYSSFKSPLVQQQILTKDEADKIFLNIDDIYRINGPFANELKVRKIKF